MQDIILLATGLLLIAMGAFIAQYAWEKIRSIEPKIYTPNPWEEHNKIKENI